MSDLPKDILEVLTAHRIIDPKCWSTRRARVIFEEVPDGSFISRHFETKSAAIPNQDVLAYKHEGACYYIDPYGQICSFYSSFSKSVWDILTPGSRESLAHQPFDE